MGVHVLPRRHHVGFRVYLQGLCGFWGQIAAAQGSPDHHDRAKEDSGATSRL
jgi:hypothetical protein